MNVSAVSTIHAQPPIVMTTVEANLLSKLLQNGADRYSEGATFLAREIRRANRIDPKQAMGNLVTLNSYVVFRYGPPDEIRMVKLVYPGETTNKDIENLPVTTLVGAALIGLSQDQSIEWSDSDGNVHRVEVILVLPPSSGLLQL